MTYRPWFGPAAALGVALPTWVVVLVGRPEVSWASVVVASLYLGYGLLVWFAALTDTDREAWWGGPLSLVSWLGVAGFSVAPVVVMTWHGHTLLLAVAAFCATVVYVSPVLSQRAADLFEALMCGDDVVRGLPCLADREQLESAWHAAQHTEPGQLVPLTWHPCLGPRRAA